MTLSVLFWPRWGRFVLDGKWACNWRADMKPFTLRGPQRGNLSDKIPIEARAALCKCRDI